MKVRRREWAPTVFVALRGNNESFVAQLNSWEERMRVEKAETGLSRNAHTCAGPHLTPSGEWVAILAIEREIPVVRKSKSAARDNPERPEGP